MMEAGSIKHHLANNISDPRNTILAVGYCAPLTLGARILSGEREVSIFGESMKSTPILKGLKLSRVMVITGKCWNLISCQGRSRLEEVFLGSRRLGSPAVLQR